MPVSTEQYEAILVRLNKLENGFNDMAVALQRMATLSAVQQLLVVVQQALASTQSDVSSLASRVTAIEEDPET